MIQIKESNFLSAVVYVHNNENTLVAFLQQLYHVLHNEFEHFEIICVNDASTDHSVAVVQDILEIMHDCVLSVINMSFYQGLEISMNAGIDLAIGDFVFEFDTTILDYPSSLIMDVYHRSQQGYDIVAASSTNRHYASNLFYRFYNRFSITQSKLTSERFRVISRRAINRVHSMSKTLPYRKALYANCGLRIHTLMYSATVKVKYSQTKLQNRTRNATAFNTLILFTDVAYKLSIALACLMMLATLITGIYVLIVFFYGNPVSGFSSMMWVMTGCFFGVFAILAIVIKYLSLLVDLVFMKQKYVINSIDKADLASKKQANGNE